MSTSEVSAAVHQLKDAILADPELRDLVKDMKTPEQLAWLWSSERFRKVHDGIIKGIKTDDVRAFLGELEEKDLDQVTGGVQSMGQINMQLLQNLSPSQVYSTALFKVLIGL